VDLAIGLHWGDGMRTSSMSVLCFGASLLALAGCHALPCGGCADYETCEPLTNRCALNDGTRFDLEAVDGEVPGDDWDPFWGPPDPYICVSAANAAEQCTTPDSDTHSPKWNTILLTDLDGTQLLTSPLQMHYWDSDVDAPDSICAFPVTLQESWLHSGGFEYTCGNGASVHFALHNTVRGTPPAIAN
jgi:hypothetical protein